MADAMLESANLVDLQIRGVDWYRQQKHVGTYFQDIWQVSQKLTLNLSLRYEYFRPWNLPRNTTATLDFTAPGRLLYALQNPFHTDPRTRRCSSSGVLSHSIL